MNTLDVSLIVVVLMFVVSGAIQLLRYWCFLANKTKHGRQCTQSNRILRYIQQSQVPRRNRQNEIRVENGRVFTISGTTNRTDPLEIQDDLPQYDVIFIEDLPSYEEAIQLANECTVHTSGQRNTVGN